jgi:nitrite reductase/ring-hydroxylating ferredoxin subunit
LQQPAPLVHVACPAVPEAFDLVICRALERDPARRFQSAGELLAAFERVFKAQEVASQANAPLAGQLPPGAQVTIPPTVDWFSEQFTPSRRWLVVPPVGTERVRVLNNAPVCFPGVVSPHGTEIMSSSQPVPAVSPRAQSLASSPYSTDIMSDSSRLPPGAGDRVPAPVDPETQRLRNNPAGAEGRAPVPGVSGASLAGIDPFAWWSSHSGRRKSQLPAAPVPARRISLSLALPGSLKRSRPDQRGRRKIVTLVVTSVATAGALSVGGITFAHLAQSLKPSSQRASAPTASPGITPADGAAATQPVQPAAAATHAPIGTVIGSTTQPVNSARVFSNPRSSASSLLIHLSNGHFVACERACAHGGVLVDYDPERKMIVCPAHGAVFDPRAGFSHVSGPGRGALPRVTIHVNDDGTITSG